MKNSGLTVYVQHIQYVGQPLDYSKPPSKQKSIDVIGIDTEADVDGKCFMIATSLGDVFTADSFPACMFTRKYRNTTFVAYNLSYDAGHFISWLPKTNIRELWESGVTEYCDYKIKSIPKKFLRITYKTKNSITFYDMLNFYRGAGIKGGSSLDSVAENVLGERKISIATKSFTAAYIKRHWNEIAEYCIKDAVLVERLGNKIIRQFEEWGVHPRALYSTAYITFQYFSRKTRYVTVHRYWYKHKRLLDYAMQSYNGGKFEVTRKGLGYYYEYDIVSAYPYEIANLIDISKGIVKHSTTYDPLATYSFLKCIITIPPNVFSPVAIKYGSVNTYPVGRYIKVITKNEYEYLLSVGCTLIVIDCYSIYTGIRYKPYKEEIERLFEYKKLYKNSGDKLLYHTVKILLNSLYGKFVQLIKAGDKMRATTCWNPIYGSIITANTRIRVSRMQQLYPSIVAVHTDSIISTSKLDIDVGKELGDWDFECEGEGVILGSGIYQIGKISKYRGFRSNVPLVDHLNHKRSTKILVSRKAISWREAAFHHWDIDMINRFITENKRLNIRFDKKRIWIKDYKSFYDVKSRNVYSIPYLLDLLDSPC